MYNSELSGEARKYLLGRQEVLLREYRETMSANPMDMYRDELYLSHVARALDRLSRSYLCNHNLNKNKDGECTKCGFTIRI